jgi:hypothetical protein
VAPPAAPTRSPGARSCSWGRRRQDGACRAPRRRARGRCRRLARWSRTRGPRRVSAPASRAKRAAAGFRRAVAQPAACRAGWLVQGGRVLRRPARRGCEVAATVRRVAGGEGAAGPALVHPSEETRWPRRPAIDRVTWSWSSTWEGSLASGSRCRSRRSASGEGQGRVRGGAGAAVGRSSRARCSGGRRARSRRGPPRRRRGPGLRGRSSRPPRPPGGWRRRRATGG